MKIWLTVLFALSLFAISAKTINVDEGQEILNLEPYEAVSYTTDSIVMSDSLNVVWSYDPPSPAFASDLKIKWVKYDFNNRTKATQSRYIYLPYHYIYKIDVYQKTEQAIALVSETGNSRHWDTKDLNARGYPIQFDLPPGKSSLIFRYDNRKLPLRSSAFLLNNRQIQNVLFNTTNKIWFWRGVFFVALLFSLMLYLSTRNKIFLYYFLFNVGVALTLGSEIGDFMNLLGADVHSRVMDIKRLGNVVMMLFFPLFIHSYTPVKNIHPTLWKVMYGGSYLAIFLMVASFFPVVKHMDFFIYLFLFFFIYTPALFAFNIYLLMIAAIKKQKNALELFLLYVVYIVLITLGVIFPTFEVTGDGIYTFNFLLYTSIGEILVFLFLIGTRVINVFIENNQLLEKQKGHQQEMIRAIVDSQEIERNKIGCEMHDLIGASIALVKNNVDPENKPIIKLIDDTIASIKSISNGLMTPRVKGGEFEEEIKNLCNLTSNEKMKVRYYFHDWPQLQKSEVCTHLYRIIQELLHNAMQHSDASNVHVQFLKREHDLCVMYEDNGKGLVYDESRKIGRGLMGIENRVQLIQGEMHIDSGDENGLSIMIELQNPNT